MFREGDWRQAAVHYSEGVNVARYAQSEALVIPPELLGSLYVNRASAHYSLVSAYIMLPVTPLIKLDLTLLSVYIVLGNEMRMLYCESDVPVLFFYE